MCMNWKNLVKSTLRQVSALVFYGGKNRARFASGWNLVCPYDYCGVPQVGGESFFGYFDAHPLNIDGNWLFLHEKVEDRWRIRVYGKCAGVSGYQGDSLLWNAQQASRAQWIGPERLAYNGRQGQFEGCCVIDLASGNSEHLDYCIEAAHSEGNSYYSLRFSDIRKQNEHYGYSLANGDPGGADWVLLRIQIVDGQILGQIDLEQVLAYEPRADFQNATHEINHVSVAPGGGKLAFIHRWRAGGKVKSRLLGSPADLSDIWGISDNGMVSHFCWRTPSEVFLFGLDRCGHRSFQLIDSEKGKELKRFRFSRIWEKDGHPTCRPGSETIFFDAYPDISLRQGLWDFDVGTGKRQQIGHLYSPASFHGAHRVDLHPRYHSYLNCIAIDSTFTGQRKGWLMIHE